MYAKNYISVLNTQNFFEPNAWFFSHIEMFCTIHLCGIVMFFYQYNKSY